MKISLLMYILKNMKITMKEMISNSGSGRNNDNANIGRQF